MKRFRNNARIQRARRMLPRCTSSPTKALFYTERHAQKVARLRGLRVYRCVTCGHWHLTSKGLTDTSNSGKE